MLTHKASDLTVIFPVFNESLYNLEQSLNSLLAQTIDFKCLIIDDSTEARTIEFLTAFTSLHSNFIYIRPPTKLGLPATLNLGIRKCSSKYIARFDSDDINFPSRFEKQVAFLNANRSIGVLGTQINLIDAKGVYLRKRYYPLKHSSIVRSMTFVCPLAHPSVMFNLEAFPSKDLLIYSEQSSCEDLELWMRLADQGIKFQNLNEILLSYRVLLKDLDRPKDHWRANLLARYKSFIRKPRLIKIFGIFAFSLISIMPMRCILFFKKLIGLR